IHVQPARVCRRPEYLGIRRGKRSSSINEEADQVQVGNGLAHQLELLSDERRCGGAGAGHVTAWSVETSHQTKFDRVAASNKDYRNASSRSLGCECRGGTAQCGPHRDIAPNQLVREGRQSIVMTLGPAIFNRHVAAFEITAFAQTFVECG